MISTKSWGSNTCIASDSEPNEASLHPSFLRTCRRRLASRKSRSVLTDGLKNVSKIRAQTSSKNSRRLPARSRWHPSPRNRPSNGSKRCRNLSPCSVPNSLAM
jgi:hypothetical protein